MFQELKDKGFGLIAINQGDSKATINKYVKDNNFTFTIAMGGEEGSAGYQVFQQYGVQAYPTNYVVDSKGNVLYRGVGFNEAQVRAALEKAGIK